MSYQVGLGCYSTLVDAAKAACSSFSQNTTSTGDGSVVTTVSCVGVTPAGGLDILVHKSFTDHSSSVSLHVEQFVGFGECLYEPFLNAGFALLPPIIGIWLIIYGYRKIQDILQYSVRRDYD